MPRVSIGLPVYNGENYLEQTLDALLAQTYGHFELLIADNASTDKTETICREYMARDARIRYYRADENRGAIWNFNRVFTLASGEYFKWAAHDDLITPDFLHKCVAVLASDAGVVLCYTLATFIDVQGAPLGKYTLTFPHATSPRPQDRFRDMIRFDHWCLPIFGVLRRSVLAKTRLFGNYNGSDRNLLAELSLLGRFHEIPEYLFLSRDHPQRSVRALPALHLRGEWFDPRRKVRRVFPHWRNYAEFIKTVRRAPLSPGTRLGCYWQLGLWFGRTWNWVRLLTDVLVAIHPGFWTLFHKARHAKRKLIGYTPHLDR